MHYILEELEKFTTEHHALFSPVEQNSRSTRLAAAITLDDMLKMQGQVCEDFISLFWEEVAEGIAGCNMAAGPTSFSEALPKVSSLSLKTSSLAEIH